VPVIIFSTLKDKILSGEKKQTIRPKRSDWWLKFKKGDKLIGYWKLRSKERELLFVSELSEDPFIVKWKDFTDELMQKDGFSDLETANKEWFIPKYGRNGKIIPEMEFVVIRWR